MREFKALFRSLDVEAEWLEPMSRHTTFRIGGPVACLVRPLDEASLAKALGELKRLGLPHFILGAGSNILPPDDPWDVAAVQLTRSCSDIVPIEEHGDRVRVRVGAGGMLSRLLRFCVRHQLGGIEFLAGIPGTVGGAVVMNAGTKRGCIGEALLWVDVLDGNGRRHRLEKSRLSVSYRSLGLPPDAVVLGACLDLRRSVGAKLRGELLEILRHRRATQPLGYPSAGCIFKNPPGASAGALIEQVGLKGWKVGGAQISEKHANWIVNLGKARAEEVLALVEEAEKRVFEAFGLRMEREIRILG
ncbi:MAG TPA: UDP-N-acetylmuramate dehydrogenase [Syntrophobacteraceae bacterium]|nr:UDP-N-acetylmuramate dehydrogenase [Syntrophobacteraceae bacterium]